MEKNKLNLSEIQAKIHAPKSQRNNFGNYNYRSCEDILEAAKKVLAEYDAWIIISDEVMPVNDRIYIKATATISNGQDSISTTAYAREEETKKGMDAAQITGSASSYARKYALNGLLAIDDTKDSDATNDHGQSDKKTKGGGPAVESKPAPANKAEQTPLVVLRTNFLLAMQKAVKENRLTAADQKGMIPKVNKLSEEKLRAAIKWANDAKPQGEKKAKKYTFGGTPKQVELIEKLLCSSVFTDADAKDVERMTYEQDASTAIDYLQNQLKIRKEPA